MTRVVPARRARPATPAARWRERQAEALGWTATTALATPRDAERFLDRYGVAARYGAVPDVPLSSLRRACETGDGQALPTSIRLTNHLLASGTGVEVNVVADRLTLVHWSNIAALYRLVRDGRAPDDHRGLSEAACQALTFIVSRQNASVGDVRRHLGVRASTRPDPADVAVAELQRAMLVDRGPFTASATGIPYLSREGYPYRLFHLAHRGVVGTARSLTREAAADGWIGAYIAGAAVGVPRSMATIFRLFLSPAEVAAAIERLTAIGRVRAVAAGRASVVEARPAPGRR